MLYRANINGAIGNNVLYGPPTLVLTHWGRVTHICVSKLTIIGSDNGLLPGRHQAIIWINAGILLIVPLGTNFISILYRNSNIFIQENEFENGVCEMASILSQPQCVMWELHESTFRITGSLVWRICYSGGKPQWEVLDILLLNEYLL